jgi:hypothetical protein
MVAKVSDGSDELMGEIDRYANGCLGISNE